MNALAAHLNGLKARYIIACQANALWVAGYAVLAACDYRAAAGVWLIEQCHKTLAKLGAGGVA